MVELDVGDYGVVEIEMEKMPSVFTGFDDKEVFFELCGVESFACADMIERVC